MQKSEVKFRREKCQYDRRTRWFPDPFWRRTIARGSDAVQGLRLTQPPRQGLVST